jgi:hypothetical protein
MDYCLNIFTSKFKEYVSKLQIIEKLESGEYGIEEDRKKITDEFKKVFSNCIEAIIPPIMMTGTSVDKDDPKLSKEKATFSLGGMMDFAGGITGGITGGVPAEGPNKNIE